MFIFLKQSCLDAEKPFVLQPHLQDINRFASKLLCIYTKYQNTHCSDLHNAHKSWTWIGISVVRNKEISHSLWYIILLR